MKFYQLIWKLLKQWRQWKTPVDGQTILAILYTAGIKFELRDLSQLWNRLFIDKIDNPRTDDVDRNQRLAHIGPYKTEPTYYYGAPLIGMHGTDQVINYLHETVTPLFMNGKPPVPRKDAEVKISGVEFKVAPDPKPKKKPRKKVAKKTVAKRKKR